MELHTCLWNDVDAFSFAESDLHVINDLYPDLRIRIHLDADDFLSEAQDADFVLTWDFKEAWYESCPRLKIIFTPAAGNDWIDQDPGKAIKLVHGTFHGPILAESLLGAVLYMNHKMPAMVRNYQDKKWDRNLQSSSSLLRNQHVLLIGLGKIGSHCARLIQFTGAEVIGVRRNPERNEHPDLEVRAIDDLDGLLPWADHVILLLPASSETDGLMNPERISLMKPGAYLYNFGRGNSLTTADLLASLDHLAGAYLDVTDEEPLPGDSPLWDKPNVMITPHSSCIYKEYKSMFLDEVIAHLKPYL